MDLKNFREKIDKIDSEIIELFAKRFEIVKQVWECKKQNGIKNPLDEKRWQEVLEKVWKKAEQNWISKDFIKIIWEEIHKEALRLEK